MKEHLLELVAAAYMSPILFGGAALCAWLQPPIWLGVGGVLVAAFAWGWFVVRRLPPFRGHDYF